jgi:hypothetical protein
VFVEILYPDVETAEWNGATSIAWKLGWGQEKPWSKDLSKGLLSVPRAPAAERSRSKM